MKLFKQLDANHKSAEENWQVLNRLDRKITTIRANANAVMIAGTVTFYAYLIFGIYSLLGSTILELFSALDEYDKVAESINLPTLFELIPLPWYAVLILLVVGVFAVPLHKETAAGYALIPSLSIESDVAGLRSLPGVVFELNIPQIMSVMSALVFSILVGLAATWTKSELTCNLLGEFQNIVLDIVGKIIIPVLPFYIAATFCNLSYEGMITHQLPAFVQIILIVMAGH